MVMVPRSVAFGLAIGLLVCCIDCQAQTVSGRVLLTNATGLVQGDVPGAWVVICRENQILKRQKKLQDQARFELQKDADGRAFDLIVGAPDMTPATYRGLVAESGDNLVLSITLQRMSEMVLISKAGRKAIDRKVADALEVLPPNCEEAQAIRDAVDRLDQKRVLSILLPAYFYPGGNTAAEWDDVFWAATQLKNDARLIVIVNVNSGPGNVQQPDPNYLGLMARLVRSDVIIIGYVRTDYGKRDPGDILRDVISWVNTYPGLSGIFFDEVSSDKKDVPYFKALCESSRKAFKGAKQPLLVGNFGVICDEGYATNGVFDLLCISECKWGDQKIERPAWDRPDSNAKYGAIIYGISSKKDLAAAFDLVTSEGSSFIYLSDQKGIGNEVLWTRLPTKADLWRPLVQKVVDWNRQAKGKK